MRELPILFSTEMVKAILEGRKTQTRRVIKPQPNDNEKIVIPEHGSETSLFFDGPSGRKRVLLDRKPYQVGDRRWVRETWSLFEDGEPAYRTNYGTTEDDSFPPSMFKWKPSIHMPKKYARIWLEVTGVRVERLQDISEKDARAEGVTFDVSYYQFGRDFGAGNHRELFRRLWNTLHRKDDYTWESNPWVWVYEFKRIDHE